MRHRRFLIGCAFGLLLLPCGILIGFRYIYNYLYPVVIGSPTYAKEWKERFEDLPDPEVAKARYPDVETKKYTNGEWIFGVCRDSHGPPPRDTIVVKDSRGPVRAFFGHVCGAELLKYQLENSTSLDDFYNADWWRGFNFHEYHYTD